MEKNIVNTILNGTFESFDFGFTIWPYIEPKYRITKFKPGYSINTVFTKEQSWKIDFATDHPKVEPFGQVIKTTAQVESAQGDEILISAKTNGVVMLSAEDVVEGKKVTNGQILFSISGRGLANNNLSTQYAEAKNNYEKTFL